MTNQKIPLKRQIEILVDRIVVLSGDLLLHLSNEDIDSFEEKTRQRQEVLSILTALFNKALESQLLPEDLEWANAISRKITRVMSDDEIILERASALRGKLQEDISKVFQYKSKFKGYNLNDLRK